VSEFLLPKGITLDGLFSRKGYRPAMALKRLEPKDYFVNGAPSEILRLRRELLGGVCEDFIFEPESQEDRVAVIHFAGAFVPVNGVQTFQELGMVWEPDFVLLNRDESQRAVGGCVCFPTGWSLGEKRKQPVAIVHGPVPGLNAQLGTGIEQFFERLRPGESYQRSNWSLTSSTQMNQRPVDAIPRITSDCEGGTTFLRVEWQALIAIDPSRILFGIRIYHCALDDVRRNGEAAGLLAENLRTMPEEMLRYKRLDQCRDRVIGVLGR
jgi:Protein of unknown function (DUF3445)